MSNTSKSLPFGVKAAAVMVDLISNDLTGEGLLDAALHNVGSEWASGINNEGLEAQVRALIEAGWKPDDIRFAAKEALDEDAEA